MFTLGGCLIASGVVTFWVSDDPPGLRFAGAFILLGIAALLLGVLIMGVKAFPAGLL